MTPITQQLIKKPAFPGLSLIHNCSRLVLIHNFFFIFCLCSSSQNLLQEKTIVNLVMPVHSTTEKHFAKRPSREQIIRLSLQRQYRCVFALHFFRHLWDVAGAVDDKVRMSLARASCWKPKSLSAQVGDSLRLVCPSLHVQIRLPNLHERSGEFCVYKWVASHIIRPKICNKCRNLSQPVTTVCIWSPNSKNI